MITVHSNGAHMSRSILSPGLRLTSLLLAKRFETLSDLSGARFLQATKLYLRGRPVDRGRGPRERSQARQKLHGLAQVQAIPGLQRLWRRVAGRDSDALGREESQFDY